MQCVIVNREKKDFFELIIRFNGTEFRISKLQLINDYNDKTEYLPGIYITVKYSSKRLPSKMKILNNWMARSKHQDTNIYLEIINKRDDILVLKDGEKLYENKKPYQDPLNEKYKRVQDQLHERKEQFKYVSTSKIMFPFYSGGWGERCIMKDIFGELKLYYTTRNNYIFFEQNEVHYAVSQIDTLKKLCMLQDPCKGLLDKFKNNKYIYSKESNWSDDITLHKQNEVYKVENANHRVCCARLFKIDCIKAKVYTGTKENNNKVVQNDRIFVSKIPLNQKLTKEYYSILSGIGLNREHAEEILEKGLRGKVLIEYIECKTGKSLVELYKKFGDINLVHYKDKTC